MPMIGAIAITYLLAALCIESALWYFNTRMGSFPGLQIPRRKTIAVAAFWPSVLFWLLFVRACIWAANRWELEG